MSDLAGFFTIAPNDGFYFAGTSNNDVLLYPETADQRLHLGTKQNDPAILVLSSNSISINGTLTASNINIPNNSLSGSKIIDGTIAATKLANDSVTSNAIVDGSIITSKLALNSVTSNIVADSNIVASKLAFNSVTSNAIFDSNIIASKLAVGAVTFGILADGAVGSNAILDGAITANKLAPGSVGSNMILDSNIIAGKLGFQAVTYGVIANGAVGSNAILDSSIIASKLAINAVGSNAILASNIIAGKLGEGSVTMGTIASNAVGSNEININAIITSKIQDQAITFPKLANACISSNSLFESPLDSLHHILAFNSGSTAQNEPYTYVVNSGVTSSFSVSGSNITYTGVPTIYAKIVNSGLVRGSLFRSGIDSYYHWADTNTTAEFDNYFNTLSFRELEVVGSFSIYTSYYGHQFMGWLRIDYSDTYTLGARISDNGDFAIYVNGSWNLISTSYNQSTIPAQPPTSGSVFLRANTFYPIRIRFAQGPSIGGFVDIMWRRSNQSSFSSIPFASFYRNYDTSFPYPANSTAPTTILRNRYPDPRASQNGAITEMATNNNSWYVKKNNYIYPLSTTSSYDLKLETNDVFHLFNANASSTTSVYFYIYQVVSLLPEQFISSFDIKDAAIESQKIAFGAVRSNAILDSNITLSKLAPSVISYMSSSVSSQWSNSNNLIYILDSNLAIGTSNLVTGFTSDYDATFNSNVTINGQLTVNNVQYVTSNVTIYNTQTVNSNITTLNTLTFSNSTGSIYLDSSNANLGIDYPTPEYKLDVNGDIRAVSYYLFSDIRKKRDIQLIEHAVDKLSNISGYTFTLNGQRSAGLIAQEVISVLPEVISQDSEGYLNISYDNMIGLLVNAVKELTSRVQTLEHRLSS